MEPEVPAEDDDTSGAPGWVMTFADLMSLLMCFFVLLLSFSEMDILKYKQIAGSMQNAFGVQREIKSKEIPKGTSVIAQEFSPGKPTPSPVMIEELRQSTTDERKRNLDFSDAPMKSEAESMHEVAEALRRALREEIEKGYLEVQSAPDEVLIRIREKASFPSGSAKFRPSFYAVLDKVGDALNQIGGDLIVAGHTDDVPISNSRYPSNWVLSAARSANVVHYLTKHARVDPARMEIRAHADVIPIAPNITAANRSKNRRVEIVVRKIGAPENLSE